MTIQYLSKGQVATPPAGSYSLFYDVDNGNALTSKDSNGTFTVLGNLPNLDTSKLDDCLCSALDKIVTDAGCAMTKGLITATEYESIIDDINLYSNVTYDPSTGSYASGITAFATLFVALSTTNVLCNGGSTGTATATVTGGVGPYTITFTDLSGVTANPAALSAGAYKITATDANGSVKTITFVITEPPALGLTVVVSGTSPTAEATALPTGGTPGYTYVWKDNSGVPIGQTTQTATGLSTGTYQVEVTDANGCTIEETNVVIP